MDGLEIDKQNIREDRSKMIFKTVKGYENAYPFWDDFFMAFLIFFQSTFHPIY